jgi:hypothetical protein
VWKHLLRILLSPTEDAEGRRAILLHPGRSYTEIFKGKPCCMERRFIKPNVDDKI